MNIGPTTAATRAKDVAWVYNGSRVCAARLRSRVVQIHPTDTAKNKAFATMLNRHSPSHTESNSGVIESNPCEYPNARSDRTQKMPIISIAAQPIFHGF